LKRDPSEIDRLLARGRLGGPRHDQILSEILKRSGTKTSARRWRLWPALVPAVALGATLVVWLGVPPAPRPAAPIRQGTMTAKGAGAPRSGAVDIGCGLDGARVCRPGETLLFRVEPPAPGSWYLSAYAQRADDPARTRIWYFPTAAGQTPVITANAGAAVAREGIEIGPEHRAGRHRVTVWLSRQLLRRSELAANAPGPEAQRYTLEFDVLDRPSVTP